MQERIPSLPGRLSSVQEDWLAWLPQPKARTFEKFSQQLETSYGMLSVSLNEALALRQEGRIDKSRQAAAVSAEVCRLLTHPLGAMLRAVEAHARRYGTLPNALPLDAANFRTARCLRAARRNALLSRILPSQRLRFLQKVRVLPEMVEDLGNGFCAATRDLVDGFTVQPEETWLSLDLFHYDLNTCLRETVVVLKSFLHVLPENELAEFERQVREKTYPQPARKTPLRDIRHRRPAAIAGE